jgi:hypothetical protein
LPQICFSKAERDEHARSTSQARSPGPATYNVTSEVPRMTTKRLIPDKLDMLSFTRKAPAFTMSSKSAFKPRKDSAFTPGPGSHNISVGDRAMTPRWTITGKWKGQAVDACAPGPGAYGVEKIKPELYDVVLFSFFFLSLARKVPDIQFGKAARFSGGELIQPSSGPLGPGSYSPPSDARGDLSHSPRFSFGKVKINHLSCLQSLRREAIASDAPGAGKYNIEFGVGMKDSIRGGPPQYSMSAR